MSTSLNHPSIEMAYMKLRTRTMLRYYHSICFFFLLSWTCSRILLFTYNNNMVEYITMILGNGYECTARLLFQYSRCYEYIIKILSYYNTIMLLFKLKETVVIENKKQGLKLISNINKNDKHKFQKIKTYVKINIIKMKIMYPY